MGESERRLQVPPDEVAGSVAGRRALGADAEEAVIDSFLDRMGRRIDARVETQVDARVAQWRSVDPSVGKSKSSGGGDWGPGYALGSIALGIPITGAATAFEGDGSILVALAAWGAIAGVNIAAFAARRRRG